MSLSSIHFLVHFTFHYGWPEFHSYVHHCSFSFHQLTADSISLLPWSQQQLARMGRCLRRRMESPLLTLILSKGAARLKAFSPLKYYVSTPILMSCVHVDNCSWYPQKIVKGDTRGMFTSASESPIPAPLNFVCGEFRRWDRAGIPT